MNIQELIQRIRTNLGMKQGTPNEAVLGFLRVLEEVRATDLTCDEIYSKLDEYVERQADRHDAAELMPLIREHLDLCPECCEEYEALLKVIEEAGEK
ncbi:MAG: hypothetical protein MHPDNHAH_01724 [Anaerolineales bacterium]|nr:hypothetical protein [Anaerolineales bacterium]WKZ49260.1 MAG: hypothetical protein QY306_07810 [Anaerolineales bacterium]